VSIFIRSSCCFASVSASSGPFFSSSRTASFFFSSITKGVACFCTAGSNTDAAAEREEYGEAEGRTLCTTIRGVVCCERGLETTSLKGSELGAGEGSMGEERPVTPETGLRLRCSELSGERDLGDAALAPGELEASPL